MWLQKSLRDLFKNENVTRYSEFSVNPKLKDAIRGAEIARSLGIDVIIAVGGGSVLDMAKLIKVFLKNETYEEEIAKGIRLFKDPQIPSIMIPTTSGSGSEATHFAVVYVNETKFSVANDCLLPDAIILDGALTLSGSKYQRTCNALDALAQAIESAWAAGSTIESRDLAFKAVSNCWDLMHKVSENECSEIEFQKMLEASNLAGQSINISKTTSAHAWSYSITSEYGLPHGHAVWMTLPAVFEIHANAPRAIVTDPRGCEHFYSVMKKLCSLLRMDHRHTKQSYLKEFLKALGIDTNFDNIGMNSAEKDFQFVQW